MLGFFLNSCVGPNTCVCQTAFSSVTSVKLLRFELICVSFSSLFVNSSLFQFCSVLTTQIKLVTEAIKMDEASELKEAAKLYCEAMAFFLPAIECKLITSVSNS